MKRTFRLLTLVFTLLALWLCPGIATANEHCHQHTCDSRCHGNSHWQHPGCHRDHCSASCNHAVPTQPQVIYVTNTLTVINTVTVPLTNYITVTNTVLTPTADLAITDYDIDIGHTYRFTINSFLPATSCSPAHWTGWRPYGIIHATSNHTARIVVPVAAFRPTVWQLVDYTPGFGRVANQPIPTTNTETVTYIGMSSRLIRVPDRRP